MVKLSETAKRYIKKDLKGLRDLSLHDMLVKRESLKKRRNISAADKEVLNGILTRAIDRRVERLVMNHPDEENARILAEARHIPRPAPPPALQTMIDAIRHHTDLSHIGLMLEAYRPGEDMTGTEGSEGPLGRALHPVRGFDADQNIFDKVDFFEHILQIM